MWRWHDGRIRNHCKHYRTKKKIAENPVFRDPVFNFLVYGQVFRGNIGDYGVFILCDDLLYRN